MVEGAWCRAPTPLRQPFGLPPPHGWGGLVDPLRLDAALGQADEDAVLTCEVACADRHKYDSRLLHPLGDPRREVRVPLGEHHPVGVGRRALDLPEHADEDALVAALPGGL